MKHCNNAKKKLELINLYKFIMKDLISKKTDTNILAAKEENFLNWSEILTKLKKTFGNDVYESWIKNINLQKEFNHYVILSVPTRFVRDWIVSRYADKILDEIKIFKKSIQRLEFLQSKIRVSEYFF